MKTLWKLYGRKLYGNLMEDIRTETLWKLYGNFMLWKFMETIRTETLLKIYANFMLWKLHLDYTDGNFIETLWNFKFSYL